jgi:hypothetical protein
MTNRLATRIGLPVPEERPADARDVLRFREPTTGAEARTKGTLFLLAQVTGGDAHVGRAARDALESIETDYYYDLSAGTLGALRKAIAVANRRLFHQRGKLGIPRRSGIGVMAVVVRAREVHVAKLGPASAVIVRGGRMYELPPPPTATDEDPRIRQRRVAASLGEALEVEPYTWEGELVPDDRIALVSRNVAQTVGVDELKRVLALLRPSQAVEHLQHLFGIRGGAGSDGMLVVEVVELPVTATTHQLEPVRPEEALAGLPDQSPVPLADAIGRGLHRAGDAADGLQAAVGRGLLVLVSWILAFVPRRRPKLRTVARTEVREEGRRRRLGLLGMVAVAGMLAAGLTVASLPAARPTEAIPRAAVARAAIAQARDLVDTVAKQVDGQDLVARSPERAKGYLNDAFKALQQARDAGVPSAQLATLQAGVDHGLDALYDVTRLSDIAVVADLSRSFTDLVPLRMVGATDGSLWVAETGRGRVIRVDPADGSSTVVYRAGQQIGGVTTGEPWLIATAATDVVVVDRQRHAWRMDLTQQKPTAMALAGIDAVSASSTLLVALQNRPPLQVFNLYLADVGAGTVKKWTPPARIPVKYPSKPESFLTAEPDLSVASATDLGADANLWLLHRSTVTRVNFGRPLPQTDFSLDAPPDAEVRPTLDYELLRSATVGERELFYVYDKANARIIAFQRADGAFVKQWMAPRTGGYAMLLDDVVGFQVQSAADGPPAAYLLSGGRVLRVVLE